MEVFFYISVVITLAYVLTILAFIIGWLNIPSMDVSIDSLPWVSVVVALRNEQENIDNLVRDLLQQDYPNFQVILVDDYSTDNTWEKLKKIADERVIVMKNTREQGKKFALAAGIARAKGVLIITTDADCRLPRSWISGFVTAFDKYNADVVLGNVLMAYDSMLSFSALQSLEFASLLASTAGATGLKLPFMANAANMAFRKQLWQQARIDFSHPSGDDVFLLFAAKKKKRKIVFLKSKNHSVVTTALPSLKDFVNQRLRWASKAGLYKDWWAIFVAALVFFMNLTLLLLLLLNFRLFLMSFLLKMIVDFILLTLYLSYYRRTRLLIWFVIEEFLYIFYAVFIGLLSQFIGFEWKGIKYRK